MFGDLRTYNVVRRHVLDIALLLMPLEEMPKAIDKEAHRCRLGAFLDSKVDILPDMALLYRFEFP